MSVNSTHIKKAIYPNPIKFCQDIQLLILCKVFFMWIQKKAVSQSLPETSGIEFPVSIRYIVDHMKIRKASFVFKFCTMKKRGIFISINTKCNNQIHKLSTKLTTPHKEVLQ